MKNKTCGDCKHFVVDTVSAVCEKKRWICDDDAPACNRFEQKVITNGEKIIACGMKELVKFHLLGTCNTCIYYNKEHTSHNDICLCPKDKTCADGIEAWLKAPAESEVEDE